MCNDSGWSDEDYPRHESSEYMTELCKYIETKHAASVIPGQENGQLRMVEGECCHTLKKACTGGGVLPGALGCA